MTRRLAVFFLVACFAFAADPETEVRAAVQKYVDIRDHPDPQALEALFTADADQLVSSGEWRKGREAMVKGTIAASQKETGKRTITVESVRFLTKTVAIADGRYEIGDRKMWTSITLIRDHSGWRIAAIRNMLPSH